MSEFMGNIANRYNDTTATTDASSPIAKARAARRAEIEEKSASSADGLSMTDFLTLMVAQFQNQSIDSTADTSDMLNQMVQMQMVQALTNMTDASIMTYAAGLVGKDVTVGQYDSEGNLQEIYGTVTATGTMDGDQVIFVGDKYYKLNEIMAVGRLPEIKEPDKTEGDKTESDTTDKTEETGGVENETT